MRTGYSLWDEIYRLQEQIEKNNGQQRTTNVPAESNKEPVRFRQATSNIFETEKDFVAEIEIPGVDKKDVEINITKDGFEVKAKKEIKKEVENSKTGYYRIERSSTGFYRRFGLPEYVDIENAKASFENGVLRIAVPKRAIEHNQTRKLIIE